MELDEFKQKYNRALTSVKKIHNQMVNLDPQDVTDIKDLTDEDLETMGLPEHVRTYVLEVLKEMKDLPSPFTTLRGALHDVIEAASGLLEFEE